MPRDLKVLIGCESSGTVRNAFTALGFDAWSCDIKPDEHGSNHHIRDDIRNVLNDGWDLLMVAHPPCTRLCNSGVRWLKKAPPGKTLKQMWKELDEGCELFSDCLNADIDCKAIENPVMHYHAKERIRDFVPAAQFVQPWWFGEEAFKATGLWLKNLPKLTPTNKLTPPTKGTPEHVAWSKVHMCPPGPERATIRSRFFKPMAQAMAAQWGQFAVDQINHMTPGIVRQPDLFEFAAAQ